MSSFRVQLGGRVLGAEILAKLARGRATGTLTWEGADEPVTLLFQHGRPEALHMGTGRTTQGRAHVVEALRRLAASTVGTIEFSPGEPPSELITLGIDTLGEALVALVRELRPAQLRSFWVLHGERPLVSTPAFASLAQAIVKIGGARVEPPPTALHVQKTIAESSSAQQMALAALVALGGLRPLAAHEQAGAASTVPSAPAEVAVDDDALPSDLAPQTREKLEQIDQVFRELPSMSHYDVLGVDARASADEIRNAYFAAAKRWHSDSYAEVPLGDRARKLEAIFGRIGEANGVLGNPEARSSYDFLLDRKRQGLPTDVAVIIEAEGLFHRARHFVRRGQAAAAVELLRQAVALNKGEAEFWAYFGYALYVAQGQPALSEALEALQRAADMNEKLDVVPEFQGRIAHNEGRVDDATRYLKRALALNPKNRDAERELRLISMRRGRQRPSSGGVLKRLFRR